MSAEGANLAAVIGWPIRHSVSPVLHSYWLREHGLKGAYVALPVAPEHFERAVLTLPLMGFAGASVTVPHKEAAFALSSWLDEDAKATGAVNTLVFRAGSIQGFNTDVSGFGSALKDAFGPPAASRGPAVVLGAGGAARAVVRALLRANAPEVRVVNRTKSRAEALVKDLDLASVKIIDWGDWFGAVRGSSLLVNTTSLGMRGKPTLEVPVEELPQEAYVADIVYNPLETDLLRLARARGLKTMDGLGMLMHQAVPAFALWFGITPRVTAALRAELMNALRA